MADLKVVEQYKERSSDDTEATVQGELDTITTEDLIKEYVQDVYPERKDKLTRMMLSLHTEGRKLS